MSAPSYQFYHCITKGQRNKAVITSQLRIAGRAETYRANGEISNDLTVQAAEIEAIEKNLWCVAHGT